jgi:hypothetical protein
MDLRRYRTLVRKYPWIDTTVRDVPINRRQSTPADEGLTRDFEHRRYGLLQFIRQHELEKSHLFGLKM